VPERDFYCALSILRNRKEERSADDRATVRSRKYVDPRCEKDIIAVVLSYFLHDNHGIRRI